jgi:hypothetical protein
MQNPRALLLEEGVLRVKSAVRELKARPLLPFLVHKLHGDFLRAAISAQFHEGGIDGDACEPGGELRPAVKIVEMQQTAQEAVLEGVFGVLAIPGDAQCGVEDLLGVALE